MAKHAAPESTEVRSKNYPLFIDQPLCLFPSEEGSQVDRAQRIKTIIETRIRDILGLNSPVSIVFIDPGNPNNPLPDNPQTYLYCRYAAMFQNVTWNELESYAESLSRVLADPEQRLFTHENYDMPAAEIFAPSPDLLREETPRVNTRVAESKKMYKSDEDRRSGGGFDSGWLREATDEVHKEVAEETAKSAQESKDTSSQSAPAQPRKDTAPRDPNKKIDPMDVF